MPTTASDIAKELGLSQSTVSRILNGDGRYRVAAQTRDRVLEAAHRMDYRPNAVARSLRSGRTNLVGLYTSHGYDARNDFLAEILGGLQHGCARHRLDLLLHIGFQGRSTDDAFNELRDGRIDGLLLHTTADDPLVERLAVSDLPVVALADPLPHAASVTCDDVGGMHLLVDYLWTGGYRRFAYVAPHCLLASVERRRETWAEELRLRGIPKEEASVLRVPAEHAEDAMAHLPQNGLPVAVCCWNDRTAYRLLRACADQGVRVPEDVAVVGFDGLLDEKLPARRLVTIRCPWVEAAVMATDLLVRQINGEKVAVETCLPVTLCPGDTA